MEDSRINAGYGPHACSSPPLQQWAREASAPGPTLLHAGSSASLPSPARRAPRPARRPTVKKDQFLLVWKKRLSHIKTSESAERARPYEVREGGQTAGAS